MYLTFNKNIDESFLGNIKDSIHTITNSIFNSDSELDDKINRTFFYIKKTQEFKQDFKKYYNISKKLEKKILFLIKDMEQDYRKKNIEFVNLKSLVDIMENKDPSLSSIIRDNFPRYNYDDHYTLGDFYSEYLGFELHDKFISKKGIETIPFTIPRNKFIDYTIFISFDKDFIVDLNIASVFLGKFDSKRLGLIQIPFKNIIPQKDFYK